MQLDERVAVVTGGGGIIGEGICRCLARAGADVVVSDLNLESAERVAATVRLTGRRSLAVKTDVRRRADCRGLISETLDAMHALDILVCGAGVGGFETGTDLHGPALLETVSEEEWDLTVDVNLKGVFFCIQAVAPHFREQRYGKIITISSIGGRKGVDFIPHYSASKAGVIVLSQAVALQLAPFNINVNTICPGVIWSPLWDKGAQVLEKTNPQFSGMSPQQIFSAMVQHLVPLQRPQHPDDIGNATVFFASAAADQITGQALNVDGGAILS